MQHSNLLRTMAGYIQTLEDPPPGVDVLWRAQTKRYSVTVDPDREEFVISDPYLEIWWYPVKKRTPCGAWLSDRFVNLNAHKKWACNTKEEAIESFIARKKRQISILKGQLAEAENDLKLGQLALERHQR